MEDVLAVYARPLDPRFPVVCVDEARKELRSTPRGSLAVEPGQGKREDYEYAREGWANLFLAVEPLAGKRHVQVTQQRTAVDFARFLKMVSDDWYPQAERSVLVAANRNTHKPASLYEVFSAEEAFRLAQRFEWHYTPEHGSWLNIAEIDLSLLERQSGASMFNPRDQRRAVAPGSGGLGSAAQRAAGQDLLALYRGGCPRQIAAALPDPEKLII